MCSCCGWRSDPGHEARQAITNGVDSLQVLLAQGLAKFGLRVVTQKQQAVDHCIDVYLAEHRDRGLTNRRRKFWHYPVTHTLFVVCEYDDAELRVLFIIHKNADSRRLVPSDVE